MTLSLTTFECPQVPGLYYIPDIISQEVHDKLVSYLESIPEIDDNSDSEVIWKKAGMANRKVLHYGYAYPYSRALKLTKTHDIPSIINELLITPIDEKIGNFSPDQAIINRYLDKQGISAHTDHKKLFKDRILCLTLGAPATMIFRRLNHPTVSLVVNPRSAYFMTGDARWEYTHEMSPNRLALTRYSVTFRNIDDSYIVPTVPLLKSLMTLETEALKTSTEVPETPIV